MDTIPFLAQKDFPLDAEVLDSMQKNYKQIADYFVKFLGVTNAIISGVEKQPGTLNYSSGLVIINSEFLLFQASTGSCVEIIEASTKVLTASGEYAVLLKKYAQATEVGTNILISKFKRLSYVSDLDNLNNSLKNKISFPTPHTSYLSIEIINNNVMIPKGEMMLCIDDLQNVTLRGKMYLKSFTSKSDTFFTLFNLNNVLVYSNGSGFMSNIYASVILGGDFVSKAVPVHPLNGCTDVYFTGYYDGDGNGGVPIETLHFRIRGNGNFEIYMSPSFNSDKYKTHGIHINVTYGNPLIS